MQRYVQDQYLMQFLAGLYVPTHLQKSLVWGEKSPLFLNY